MLKLTRELFLAAPDAELGDYYEKALYNHILGSIDPRDGMTIYFLALENWSIQGVRYSLAVILVLQRYGYGEPCQVWRQHLLP